MKCARAILTIFLGVSACLNSSQPLRAQDVIDRIVARVENDVILLSDVRLLSRYQLLVDGKSESDSQILNRLIDQWIVRSEATVARTPKPTDAEIERGLQRLEQGFANRP